MRDGNVEHSISLIISRLILSWQLLRVFEPWATSDLFGSATVKKPNFGTRCASILLFRLQFLQSLPGYRDSPFLPNALLSKVSYLFSLLLSPTKAWSGHLHQRSDSNFPSAFPKKLLSTITYPGAGLGCKCRSRAGNGESDNRLHSFSLVT